MAKDDSPFHSLSDDTLTTYFCTQTTEACLFLLRPASWSLSIADSHEDNSVSVAIHMNLITPDTAVNAPCFRLQATVGAGLPVIATLRHLIETGDKILRVEGIFSGTLSYIFNSFKPGTTFSSIVAQVKIFTCC